MKKKTLKSMLFTGVALTTFGALSINEASAQSYILEERARRQREGTENVLIKPVVEETKTEDTYVVPTVPAPEPKPVLAPEPKPVVSPQDQHRPYTTPAPVVVDIGSFSVARNISSFKLSLDDENFLMDTLSVPVKFNNKQIAKMVYESEEIMRDSIKNKDIRIITWKYEGPHLTDFGEGAHKLNLNFVNKRNQSENYVVNFEVTNQRPVLDSLQYTMRDVKTGDVLEGSLVPRVEGSQYVYDAGKIPANYVLETVSFKATDEDGNLVTKDKPLFYNNKQIGDLFYNENDSTFNYVNDNQHLDNLPLGVHSFKSEIYDLGGKAAQKIFIFETHSEAPRVREVNIEFKDGTVRDIKREGSEIDERKRYE